MTLMRYFFFLIFFFSSIGYAQSTYSGLDHINRIILNAPGVTTQSINGGVNAVATGSVNVVTPSGLKIPVPTTATASVSKAAIASAASKLLRGVSLLGLGVTAYEIYKAYQESGYQTCPPPNFFCKPEVNDIPGTYQSYSFPSLRNSIVGFDQGCSLSFSQIKASFPSSQNYQQATGYTTVVTTYFSYPAVSCRLVGGPAAGGEYDVIYRQQTGSCPSGTTLQNGKCVSSVATTPYTDQELQQAFLDKLNADPSFAKRYYDAIRSDNLRNQILNSNDVLPSDTPLTVQASPVTTPETIVKTRTIPNADGTTSTEITKEKVTVTPTTTGTTVGDSATQYKTSTVTTVTTINNTTNQITNQTTTQDAPAKPDPSDPCRDNPNRAGCVDLGQPPSSEALPRIEVPITFSPINFASSAGCPAPITFEMYGMRSISYQPMCDLMTTLRPLFLACAAAACALIFMEGLKA